MAEKMKLGCSAERGLAIPEESNKCCCCIPLGCGARIIACCILLGAFNGLMTIMSLIGNVTYAICFFVALAPWVFAGFLVFAFLC